MKLFSRALLVFSLLLACAQLGLEAAGDTEPSASAETGESKTVDRIREAWGEIHRLQREGKSAEVDRGLETFAAEFFETYLAEPNSTAGQQALATAFRMWGRVGNDAAVEAAMSRVDRGSKHWLQLIQLARPAFVASDRLDEFRSIVSGLAEELTDPEVASEVWIELGRDFRSAGDPVRSGSCFRRAVALEANPRLVATATRALGELDRLAVGSSAPDFSGVDLLGRRVRLSDYRGRFVFLLFWSGDCAECIAEIDHLRRVRFAHPGDRLELLGVALDPRAEDVLRVVEARRIDWPQIHDEPAPDGPVARLYEVREVPRSFLIDPQGRIVAREVGGEALDALLARLLAVDSEPEPEPASNGR